MLGSPDLGDTRSVSLRPTRRFKIALMLAAAVVQAAAASAPLAGAWLVLLDGASHHHHVQVVPQQGHVHVVLSHEHEHATKAAAWRAALAHAAYSQSDHVLELDDGDRVSASRVRVDPTPPLAFALDVSLLSRLRVTPHRPPEPPPGGAALARTVVLRL